MSRRRNLELDTNNHSVFSLHYHLVLVVKYRRKVITDRISERLEDMFRGISKNYGITLMEWNHDADRVHVLFRAEPNTPISKFMNAYKSASSRVIKKEFPQIREKLWKEHFWSKSYCLISAVGAPLEVLKQYIEAQGESRRNTGRMEPSQ